jgi:hypothetical protein
LSLQQNQKIKKNAKIVTLFFICCWFYRWFEIIREGIRSGIASANSNQEVIFSNVIVCAQLQYSVVQGHFHHFYQVKTRYFPLTLDEIFNGYYTTKGTV